MRKLIGLVVATAALLITGMANAAQVDLFLTQQGTTSAPSNDWVLTMNVTEALSIGGISVQIASAGAAGSFVLGQPGTVIDPLLPVGLSFYSTEPGNVRLGLAAGTQLFISQGIVTNFLIGTFTASSNERLTTLLNPGNVLDGDTAADTDFNALTYSLTTTPVAPPVPEPAMLVLLGLGLGGISLARRKSA